MHDITLYPIHSDGQHVQYAGHVMLWNSDEVSAYAIARAMLIGQIVGVELARYNGRAMGERSIDCVGWTFAYAVAQTMGEAS